MSKPKSEQITDFDDDFGFSFTNEDTLTDNRVSEKLAQLEKLILPLLENLKKNPEKEYIHWPNRTSVIDRQIEKIKSITRG
jgi:hypothetical protein